MGINGKDYHVNENFGPLTEIRERINQFLNLDESVKQKLWFISPAILISEKTTWKLMTMTLNYLYGFNAYASNQSNNLMETKNIDFLKEIHESIKAIGSESYIENIEDIQKVKDYLSEFNFDNEISDDEIIDFFKMMELIEY